MPRPCSCSGVADVCDASSLCLLLFVLANFLLLAGDFPLNNIIYISLLIHVKKSQAIASIPDFFLKLSNGSLGCM